MKFSDRLVLVTTAALLRLTTPLAAKKQALTGALNEARQAAASVDA